jgi:hypothetical protein
MLQLADARAALAEVDELSARARQQPDSSLEAQIIAARHRLGRQLLSAPMSAGARAVSPVSLGLDDPFPDVDTRPPEIGRRDLDVDLLRGAIAHHGCLLVHDFFPAQTMALLRDDIDRLADGFDAWSASDNQRTTPPWYEPFEAPDAVLALALRNMCGPLGTFYAADAPRPFLHLTDAFDAAGLQELMLEYLHEPVLLGLEKTALRRVPPGVPTAWHQDGIRFGRDVGLLNVWVSLCHCGTDAPTLGVLPKRLSEILPLDSGSSIPWEIQPAAMAAAAEDVEPVELVLEPGDAILFDEMLAHSTIRHDRMTKPRYCADAWFFPLSAFPADLYQPLAYAVPPQP